SYFTTASSGYRFDDLQRANWRNRLAELHDRAETHRLRQAELQRWIREIDEDARHFQQDHRYSRWASNWDAALRSQIQDVDDQIVHLRRTLVEVRGLIDSVRNGSTPSAALGRPTMPYSPVSHHRYDRVFDVNEFANALDRFDSQLGWGRFYSDAYRPIGATTDIESRVAAATRQIDWLLRHYDQNGAAAVDWYTDSLGYRSPAPANLRPEKLRSDQIAASADSILQSLRAIRTDLNEHWRIDSLGRSYHSHASQFSTAATVDLSHCEQWLCATIDRLSGHRVSLLQQQRHNAALIDAPEIQQTYFRHPNWATERSLRLEELQRVTAQLENSLAEAAQLRHSLRHLPLVESVMPGTSLSSRYDSSHAERQFAFEHESVLDEIRRIDQQISLASRSDWLQARRLQILEELGSMTQIRETLSPLAEAASRWLVRLSGGRLRTLSWDHGSYERLNDARSHHNPHDSHREVLDLNVRIDSRKERGCCETDRALAALAVRMAAADLLARTEQAVPLVIETPSHLLRMGNDRPDTASIHNPAYSEFGDDHRWNSPFAAAVFDFARVGRQVLLLTSDVPLAEQISRTGGRLFQLHTVQTVHAHRPIWKSQYASEEYVGPHPHVHGKVSTPDLSRDPHPFTDRINRDFDRASFDSPYFDS
ncbi:MAG: hypothetical protein AAGA03_19325, partial [Planctomycetota bacterium]